MDRPGYTSQPPPARPKAPPVTQKDVEMKHARKVAQLLPPIYSKTGGGQGAPGTIQPVSPGEATKGVAKFGRLHRGWHRALNVHQKWR